VNTLVYQVLASCKRRIAARIRHDHRPSEVPLLAASNIHYELSARDRGIACGGIGAVHLLARQSGLIANLDRRLQLLKIHQPYHESDHVLTIAYNIIAGGDCLEDLELLRQDEGFLDALGATRIPDPTTAGDFCRRFDEAAVWTLMDTVNQTRQALWALQPPAFFTRAMTPMFKYLSTMNFARPGTRSISMLSMISCESSSSRSLSALYLALSNLP